MAAYEDLYEHFDSPAMQRLRAQAYGEDIGQHSWISAEELRRDADALELGREGRLLDVGCGPGGPLTALVQGCGCAAIGLDASAAALASSHRRAQNLGLGSRVLFVRADLDRPLPLASGSVHAVIAIDVVLHLRDRRQLYSEVRRVLTRGGRFLLTDAGILTGPISAAEIAARAAHGRTTLVPPGYNEQLLAAAGLTIIGREERTAAVSAIASARLEARERLHSELRPLEGEAAFESQRAYLSAVATLAGRGALSRMMYLAQSQP